MLRRYVLVTCISFSAFTTLGVAPAGASATESCPNEALRAGSLSSRLPDCRAYEQVSPVVKEGTAVKDTLNEQGLLYKAAQDGQQMFYVADNALSGAAAGGETFYLASRAAGWTTVPLSPPNLLPVTPQSGPYGVTGEYRWISEDLRCQIAQSAEPLTADTPAADVSSEIPNLYRRNADGTYTLLSSGVPSNSSQLATSEMSYGVLGASPDCKRILFQTNLILLADAPEHRQGLYEWDEGTLRLAGLLPDESAPVDGVEGISEEASPWNRVSQDGSRVLFVADADLEGEARPQVLMREDNGQADAKTVDVSASQTSTRNKGATFEAASKTGAQVFFISNYGLSSASTSTTTGSVKQCSLTGNGCDLYRYDAESGALTDLSADSNGADSTGADVVGVLGISEDGSYVYFAATGQLTPASGDPRENTQEANVSKEELNVYLSQGGELSFVARITRGDAFQNGPFGNADLITRQKKWSARVTPDGEHLLFTSRSRLTSYDNTDAVSAVPDIEAYLYSSGTGTTNCVSCDPSGVLPDYKETGEESTVIPISQAQGGGVPGDVPRVLSDDGSRVFFESSDALSPLVKSLEDNVYEWESAGNGGCTTAGWSYGEASGGCVFLLDSGLPESEFVKPATFVDASADGDDVFLNTATSLMAQDKDSLEDIYDVRVDGGFAESQPGTVCEGEACQGLAAGSPTFGTPSSASFSGAGNAHEISVLAVKPKSLTRAQKLARALKVCQGKKNKRKREACKRQARKRYGAKLSRKVVAKRGSKG